MVKKSALLSILLEFLVLERIYCFIYCGSDKVRHRSGWFASTSILTSLKATVYYPSWDNDSARQNMFGFDDNEKEEKTHHHRDVTDVLIFPEDRLDALTRLAVAYAPSDHGLSLDNIDRVEVLRIDESHIDISAVVCDQHECVTIAVPVNFPQPCSIECTDDELTTCVIDNVAFLDIEAGEVLREKELSVLKHESGELRHLVLPSDDDINDVDLPFWWVPAGLDSDMVDECDSARRLLNEEVFRSELRALAKASLVEQQRYCENYEMMDVGVVRVGPAGLYLRILLRELHFLQEDDEIKTIDVAVAFGKEAMDVHQLRTSVLEVVSTVSSYT